MCIYIYVCIYIYICIYVYIYIYVECMRYVWRHNPMGRETTQHYKTHRHAWNALMDVYAPYMCECIRVCM